jgi:hypothetical protein
MLIPAIRILPQSLESLHQNTPRFVATIGSLATLPILAAAGFAATGPVASSAAAAWQASIGIVEVGSLFAWCQSAAMGGAALNGIVTMGFSGLTFAASATAVQSLESGTDTVAPSLLKEKFGVAWSRQLNTGSGDQQAERR